MKPSGTNLYWVDTSGLARTADDTAPRIAIVPCPTGGPHLADAIHNLRLEGIDSLTSLLAADEVRVLGLEEEARLCYEAGIEHLWLPVTDHSIPDSMEDFRAVVELMRAKLRLGKGIGAHCYAGIGRSCMLMACLLCLEGLTHEEAFARLSAARGLQVPDTWLQSEWVRHFADSLESNPDPASSVDIAGQV